uniref:Zinc finger protein 316-like isoform X1 n=1 Tax=Petromyzon marinus TaxID=7757 RepID=A0AAJ7X6E8_PETMA|nr:zinc finger protein 316-like isoform X1 [Petromyzon marinus]XP_032822951.1 zinc finger protein 316-like isoform X1 [Petromyzon marinus]
MATAAVAAAVVSHINPRQDFPAWLAAHGVSLSVAEAVDRELGIGDYEAFMACAEQPHVRAEMFAAARERLPFAFYAVLRRVTEASSPKRHDGAGGACGGGIQATSVMAFQPFLSGLLDAIVLMLSSLSQELLQSVERFSDLHGLLYVTAEEKAEESSHHRGDAALDSSFAEEYEDEVSENMNELSAEKDFQEERGQNDRWPESNCFHSDGMIADEAGRSEDEREQTPEEMLPDGPEDRAVEGHAWGLVGVKAEPIADEAGRSDGGGDRTPDEMLPDAPEDRVARGNVWGVLGVKAEPIAGGNGSEDLMFEAGATQHPKFRSFGPLAKARLPPHQSHGPLPDGEPARPPPNLGEPFGDARMGGECPGSDSTGEGCSDELAGDFGAGPFTCTDCGLAYSDMNKLWRHQAFRHGGEKPYVCDVCRSRFSLVRNLNQHKKIHTGEKPFVCEECGMSFGRKYHLHRHKKIHTIL